MQMKNLLQQNWGSNLWYGGAVTIPAETSWGLLCIAEIGTIFLG